MQAWLAPVCMRTGTQSDVLLGFQLIYSAPIRNASGTSQLTAYGFPLPIAKLQTIFGTLLLAQSAHSKRRKSLRIVAEQINYKPSAIPTKDLPTSY